MSKINSIPNEVTASFFYDEFTVVTGNSLGSVTDTNQRYGIYSYQNPIAQNDEVTVKFNLAPGTYTLYILGLTNTVYAISTVSIDGVSQGTIDWYSSTGPIYNITKTISITVTSNATHSLNLKAATKSASSTNYAQIFTKLWIK